MGKMMGMLGVLGGIAYLLYQWILEQKIKYRQMEDVLNFLQRSIFAMEDDKLKVIEYFRNYTSKEAVLEETLKEIARRLEQKIYPDGQVVWENVFWEKRWEWNVDKDTLGLFMGIGRGFFGKKRGENLCFLKRDLCDLERMLKEKKETDARERKVWIPVGMLGGIMLMIILV